MKQRVGQSQKSKGKPSKSRFKGSDIANLMCEEINRGVFREDHEWVARSTDDGAKGNEGIRAADVTFVIFDTKVYKEE